ncbi:hypothetical protein CMQ_4849 [Grosmannia clavigera kw1407]|uniref:Uncharacterized protein n=1 Tax=Grosmannia clavigera (strain kw1407 / UAMH 11150) TaxID=655863 RepID=F0XUJ9_GROCL|nr:uncharacterized protein CMQ_4849 [Grosmannia clavigera kw1407]EFW98997.1 hypothetical protein CMQ_4849 [Grosmannia clavigera kw1407]
MALLSELVASLAGFDGMPSHTVAAALFGAALSLLVGYIWKSLQTRATAIKVPGEATITRPPGEKSALGFDAMGEIEPLVNLDWKAERPERIYKFADKYNLTMGLRKTTINTITRIDQQYVERIAERKRILEQYPGALGCQLSAEAMVRELYSFLLTHYLPRRYPTVFVLDADAGELHNRILDERLPTVPPTDILAALRTIALVVDEDFLMLLPSSDGDGYSLQAFVWLYPVGFDPVDKLGIKLRDAHGPVPGYKQHMQLSMDRYFERLTPGRVVDRVNWAVATNSSLCERGEYHLYSDDQVSVLSAADIDLDDTWVRCELQTLFGLSTSGGRILSVHLYLYPIREIKQVGLAEAMIRATDGYGLGNAPAFARYKRTPVWGDVVKAYLRSDEDLDADQLLLKRACEAGAQKTEETEAHTR